MAGFASAWSAGGTALPIRVTGKNFKSEFPGRTFLWFCLFALSLSAYGQAQTGSSTAQPLITQAVTAQMQTLSGTVRPGLASLQDAGPTDDSLQLSLYLVLKRSASQQADLENLISRQQQPNAPEYHQWLTPQQFGQRFGAAQRDIATVTSWLQSQGLQVNGVMNNAGFIDFTASVAQIRQLFGSQLHNFRVNGATYPAALNDPMVPAALAPAIASIEGLTRIPPNVNVTNPRQVSYDALTHSWNEVNTSTSVNALPDFNAGPSHYNVTPQDLYAIYNVNKVFSPAGLNTLGANSSVAVIEESDIVFGTVDPNTNAASGGDVATFRALFGVPGTLNMHVYHGYGSVACNSPGIDPHGTGEEIEAALDAEWANALAPSANLIFMSCDQNVHSGINSSLMAVIDNNLADVLSLSYGLSESYFSAANYTLYDNLWTQAAAQGQSVLVSSGDSGSDVKDQNTSGTAVSGINVSGFASSPLVTSAGGTDFSDYYDSYRGGPAQSTYWGGTNSGFYADALGYVPETTWNNTCAGSLLASFEADSGAAFCALGGSYITGDVVAGSGGFSSHYSVPTYQSGILGYSGTQRAQPDISGFASNGFWAHALIYCDSFRSTTCSSSTTFGAAGGTSFVAPYMAGVAGLLVAHTGSRQGLLNPALYALAKTQFTAGATRTACYANGQTSNTGVTASLPAAGCTFNDVTTGNNDVPCQAGSTSCYVNPGAAYGMLSLTGASSLTVAFPSTPGYDESTGIGSVNVYNLLANWNSAFSSSVSLQANPTSIAATASTTLTANVTTSVPPGYADPIPPVTGSVYFYNGNAILSSCSLSGATCSISVSGAALLPGVNPITAIYVGNSSYPSSSSTVQDITVLAAQTITFGTIPQQVAGTSLTLTASASSGLTVTYSAAPVTVCAVSGTIASFTAAGQCTITASQAGNSIFTAATPVTRTFAVVSAALTPQTITFGGVSQQTVGTPLTLMAAASSGLAVSYSASPISVCAVSGSIASFSGPGQCSITASQAGNSVYAAATPITQTFTVVAAASAEPVITNVTMLAVGGNSEVISWNTDQPATSLVNYGPTSSYGSSSALDKNLVTTHSVTLSGLSQHVTYDFNVVSANSLGVAATTNNASFTTTPYVGYVAFWGVNSSGITISWSTDVPANTFVQYGTTPSLGQTSSVDPTLSNSHGVVLTGLNGGTTYYFRTESTDASGNTGASAVTTFTTGNTGSPAPVISYVLSWGITSTGASISWSTNEPATTQLAYGTTTALGQMTPQVSTLTSSHGVVLTGLTPGVTYYFAARSQDVNNNLGSSAIMTFTTTGSTAPTGQ